MGSRTSPVSRLTSSKPKRGGALAESTEDARALLGIVGVGPEVAVDEVALEGAIDEDGEFASGGRDRLRLPDASGQAAIERAERGLGAPEAHHGHAQDGSGAIGRRGVRELRSAPPGNLVLGREGQPGGEVLLGGPARHVGADFRDQPERGVGRNPVDLREVDAAREVMQRGADLEPGFVVARLLGDAGSGYGGVAGVGQSGGQRLDVRLDGAVTGGQLRLTGIEEFEILLQDEEMLGPIVAGQRRDDLGLGGLTAIVAMLGEVLRDRAGRRRCRAGSAAR